MKKKALSLALALVMCLSLTIPALAAEESYTIQNGVVTQSYLPNESATIPDGVTALGYGSFWGKKGLHSITMPDSVVDIGLSAFRGCEYLTTIKMSKNVVNIAETAFASCKSLTSIELPNTLVSIGKTAFAGCESLTSVTIPDSVTSMDIGVFGNCYSLASVHIGSGLDSIPAGTFTACGLTSVTIPNNITSIGDDAFSKCGSLASVAIPDSVTTIESGVFKDCRSLRSITLPNKLTTITSHTFNSCLSLTSVTIPSSVTKIEGFAFNNCLALTDIYYGGTEAQWNAIEIEERAGIPRDLNPSSRITIHFSGSQPTTPTQPAGSTASNGAQVSGWAKDRVNVALSNNLAPAGLGNDYRGNITRGQFAATAVKLYQAMGGQAGATGASSFTDTTDPVILLAADLGFVSGVGGGKFDPNALVNREQAAVMLSSVYAKLGGSVPTVAATTFNDNGDVSGWAKSAVAFMNGKEIVTGVGNNNFSPKGSASIEQALLISLKMFETLK